MAVFKRSLLLATLVAFEWTLVALPVAAVEGKAYPEVLIALEESIPSEQRAEVFSSAKELLKETSEILEVATGLKFHKVAFLLPKSWQDLESWVSEPVDVPSLTEIASEASITVKSVENSVFGKHPFTVQYGGCGQKGLGITISTEFLLKEEISVKEKAKITAREWIKNRYGVFNENGHREDDRYPLFFRIPGKENSEIEITECTNDVSTYHYKDESGNACDLGVNEATGLPLPDSSCTFSLDDKLNENITSSLMYWPTLSSMEQLCGDETHPHNSYSVNKQNVLCNSRSIWEVLKEHEDFKENSAMLNDEPEEALTFRLMQEQNQRFVVAVDNSNKITKAAVINNAISRFIYDLPVGTELGVLKYFGDQVESVINLEELGNTEDRNRRVSDVNFLFNKPEVSRPECAIQNAVELLIADPSKTTGEIVLLATTDPQGNITLLLENLDSSDICLVIFLFPGATQEGFEDIVKHAPCSTVFQIEDGNDNEVLKQLYEKFQGLVPSANNEFTVANQELTVDTPVSFVIDNTVKSLKIWLTNPSKDRIDIDETDVELQYEDSFTTQLTKIKTQIQFLHLQVKDIEPGKWTFKQKNAASQPLLLDVTAISDSKDVITVDVWTNEVTEKEFEHSTVILYTKVMQGPHPVANAKVEATVNLADSTEPFIFELYDNGLGDPDITKNDGIYSRYFTKCNPEGIYDVTVKVTDNSRGSRVISAVAIDNTPCCGSIIHSDIASMTGLFNREIKTQVQSATSCPKEGYEPSRILDFRVSSMRNSTYFTLQWSAPGGEKDHGSAENYIFAMYGTQKQAILDSSSINGGFNLEQNITPTAYASSQQINMEINEKILGNQSYFFGIKSVNSAGKASKVSNIVEVFIPYIYEPTTVTDSISEETSDPPLYEKAGVMDGKTIGIIVGVTVSGIIIIVLAYAGFYYCHVKPKREKEEIERRVRLSNQRPEIRPNDSEIPKLNNTNDGTVPANEWQMDRDPISPVNSVPAKILLYHHEQVKDAKRQHKEPPLFRLENFQNDGNPNVENASNDINQNDTENEDKVSTNEDNVRDINETQKTDRQEMIQSSSSQPSNFEPPYAKPKRTTNV